MKVTKFSTRNLLLVLLVALLAVATGLTDSKADFRQCGQALNSPVTERLCDAPDQSNFGTAGADVVSGSNGPDDIALDGGDTLGGGTPDPTGPIPAGVDGGNDLVNGGPGDDVILGGSGNDTVMGDAGNDAICTQDGDDTVFPGEHTQNDDATAVPGTGPNVVGSVRGTNGDDLNGGTNCNSANGTRGNNILNPGEESINTGAGDDKVWIFASEIRTNAQMFVDCGPGANDTVNLIGFGVQGQVNLGDVQTKIFDPITGDPTNSRGDVVLVNCERVNGTNGF